MAKNGLLEGCETAPTDTIEGFQPGEKQSEESLSLFPQKSSVETTDTNNGFQPGDKKRTYKTIFIGKKVP